MKNKYNHPFKVSKNYFEELKHHIKQNTLKENVTLKDVKKRSQFYYLLKHSPIKLALTSAAVIFIVFTSTYIVFKTKDVSEVDASSSLIANTIKTKEINNNSVISDELKNLEVLEDIEYLISDKSIQPIFIDYLNSALWEDTAEQLSIKEDELDNKIEELSEEVLEEWVGFDSTYFYDI